MAAKIKSLLQWCKRQCEGYRDVEMTNMTSSWKSGLAFCAIIHRYRPDLIDYDSLSKENVYENNKLAFDVAQEHLNIPALLDPEDMVAMAVPDKLCIVTYVSQYYNCFSKMEPAGGPGVRQYCSPPKRALSSGPSSSEPEVKKVIPTKHLLSDQNGLVHQTVDATQRSQRTASSAASKRGTYGDKCHICGQKVYLMERHIDDGQLYHRRCIREKQKSVNSPKRPKQAPSAFQWPTDKDSAKKEDRGEARVTSKKDESRTGQFNVICQKTGHQVSQASVTGQSTSSSLTKSDSHKPGASSNLVKMLYGAATPYPSSDHSVGKQTEKLSEPSVPQAASVSSRNVSSHTHLNDMNKTKNKGSSILERAALFDNDPKPLFGSGVSGEQKPVSSTVRRAPVTATRTSPRTTSSADVKPEMDTVTYTYHPGARSSTTNHAVTQPVSKGNIRSGLLQSLANIRQQKGQSDSQSPSTTESLTNVKSNPTSAKDSSSAFLGQTSGLSDSRHSKDDENLAFRASLGDFNVGSQSGDGKKSILKQGISHQLHEGPSHKEPKTILKPRLNETLGTASVEDQLKPILKSRRCSEEADLETGSAGNPRPILKSASPTELSQLVSSSPPKSILKSRETSPESIHRPSKSILKSKDSLEDMEVDEDGAMSESKPKSILKHTHEDGSRAWDDMATSPIRSILKHAAPRPESRSILKTPGSTAIQSANVNTDAPSATVNDSLPTQSSEIKLPSPKPSPRAQVNDKAKSPQPAPRSLISKHSSDVPKPNRPNHPPSRDRVQSTSNMDGAEETQQQFRDRSAPKSILKTMRDATEDKSESCSVLHDKQIPEAPKSSGNPTMSSSLFNRHGTKCDQPKADPINNFSAFNLNDSLVIHAKQNLASGAGKSINSNDRHQPAKSAWQMEMEARRGIQPRESKLQPPPRPVAPALSKNRSSPGITSHTQEDKSSSTITKKHHEVISNGSTATKDPDLEVNKQKYSMKPASDLAGSSSERAKTSTPPPRPPPPITHSQGLSGQEAGLSHLPSNNLKKPNDSELRSPKKHDSAMSNSRANLSRSPAFRIADSPQSSPESNRNALVGDNSDQSDPESSGVGHSLGNQSTHPGSGDTSSKRKIVPDTRFSFQSIDFSEISPQPTPEPGKGRSGSVGLDPIQSRPLPSPPDQHHRSPPKRRVNAEARIKTTKIIEDLEKLDKDLQILEKEGRALEEKIRAVTDDDDVEDALMAKWFEMINKKNELVRKESELMYRKRQQELEDLHMDLEYELRLLLEKPENEKTASDRVRENALIQELLETVNERNHIVDSMEEDRKRYIAEDQEIADMMAKTGLLGSENDKKKKHDKRKQHEKKNCLGKESPEKKKKENQNHLNTHATKDRKHFKLSVG